MGAVADSRDDTGFAMIVPVMFFVLSWSYALCVNFVPAYRDPADKIGASKIGLEPKKDDEEAAAAGFDTADVLKADAKEIEVVGEGLSGKA